MQRTLVSDYLSFIIYYFFWTQKHYNTSGKNVKATDEEVIYNSTYNYH